MTSLEKLLNGSGLGKVWKTLFECVQKITGNVNFEKDGNLQEQISELSSKTVHVDANQSLTDAQKTTARNNIGVGEASKKGVDISISAASKSTNLPTSAAVASFVEGKGYKTTDTWRGIQNNLTSDSTTDSLSAAQGKALATGSARDNTKLSSSGDSKNCTATFTSGDSNNATNWTDVGLLTSGEKHSSMLQKIATMFKNVRYLYHMLGTADISTFGDGADIGTVTGAISKLNSDFENCHDTSISLDDTNFPANMSKHLCVVNDGIIKHLVEITGIVQKSPIFVADSYELGNAVMSLGDIRFAITRISIDDNPSTQKRALCIEWFADGHSFKGYIDLDFNEDVS